MNMDIECDYMCKFQVQIPFESGTQALSRRQLLQVACGELQDPKLLIEQLG